MREVEYIPLEDCLVAGVYRVKVRGVTTLAVCDDNKRFVHSTHNTYGTHLIAEAHVDAKDSVGSCAPLEFYGMLPQGITMETNLGLVCAKCGKPVSGSPWEHTNENYSSHKASAVWKPNVELVNYLESHANK